MRINIKKMTLLGALGLVLCFCMGEAASAQSCRPSHPKYSDGQLVQLPSRVLAVEDFKPGVWTQVAQVVSPITPVMGTDCGNYGISQKSFIFRGATQSNSRFLGITAGKALLEISSTTKNVGVTIEVTNANGENWISVPSDTGDKYITFAAGEMSPSIKVRLTEYIRVPVGQQAGEFVKSSYYNANIFPYSMDRIRTATDLQPEAPIYVNVGRIQFQAPTCTASDKAVDMPDVNPVQLPNPGSTSDEKQFEFDLTNCNVVVKGVHMTFESAAPPLADPTLFATNHSNLGLGLVSLDSNDAPSGGQRIDEGSKLDFTPAKDAENQAEGNQSYRFKAFWQRIGSDPIVPGSLNSRVRVMVDYD